jgi:hypothetical protein
MTDLTDLLDSAAGQPPAPTPDVVAADLLRGRRALLHRRWARGSALVLAGAAAVAAMAVVPGYVGGDDEVQVVIPASGQQVDPPNPGVDLVRFDAGAHPKPLSPGEIPAGWTVSGNEYALVLSPPGLDTSPDDFVGKLVVYLDSGTPDESLPEAVEVAVGDRTGYAIRADAAALQVWVRQDDGTALRAQAPLDLGWDEATLGRFLGGVQVGAGARATSG